MSKPAKISNDKVKDYIVNYRSRFSSWMFMSKLPERIKEGVIWSDTINQLEPSEKQALDEVCELYVFNRTIQKAFNDFVQQYIHDHIEGVFRALLDDVDRGVNILTHEEAYNILTHEDIRKHLDVIWKTSELSSNDVNSLRKSIENQDIDEFDKILSANDYRNLLQALSRLSYLLTGSYSKPNLAKRNELNLQAYYKRIEEVQEVMSTERRIRKRIRHGIHDYDVDYDVDHVLGAQIPLDKYSSLYSRLEARLQAEDNIDFESRFDLDKVKSDATIVCNAILYSVAHSCIPSDRFDSTRYNGILVDDDIRDTSQLYEYILDSSIDMVRVYYFLKDLVTADEAAMLRFILKRSAYTNLILDRYEKKPNAKDNQTYINKTKELLRNFIQENFVFASPVFKDRMEDEFLGKLAKARCDYFTTKTQLYAFIRLFYPKLHKNAETPDRLNREFMHWKDESTTFDDAVELFRKHFKGDSKICDVFEKPIKDFYKPSEHSKEIRKRLVKEEADKIEPIISQWMKEVWTEGARNWIERKQPKTKPSKNKK
jgi:hypothetical protein